MTTPNETEEVIYFEDHKDLEIYCLQKQIRKAEERTDYLRRQAVCMRRQLGEIY